MTKDRTFMKLPTYKGTDEPAHIGDAVHIIKSNKVGTVTRYVCDDSESFDLNIEVVCRDSSFNETTEIVSSNEFDHWMTVYDVDDKPIKLSDIGYSLVSGHEIEVKAISRNKNGSSLYVHDKEADENIYIDPTTFCKNQPIFSHDKVRIVEGQYFWFCPEYCDQYESFQVEKINYEPTKDCYDYPSLCIQGLGVRINVFPGDLYASKPDTIKDIYAESEYRPDFYCEHVMGIDVDEIDRMNAQDRYWSVETMCKDLLRRHSLVLTGKEDEL